MIALERISSTELILQKMRFSYAKMSDFIVNKKDRTKTAKVIKSKFLIKKFKPLEINFLSLGQCL